MVDMVTFVPEILPNDVCLWWMGVLAVVDGDFIVGKIIACWIVRVDLGVSLPLPNVVQDGQFV